MKLRWYHFNSSSQVKIQISNFFLIIFQILGFQCCNTHEELSIDASITNVRLILTKLR